MQEQQQPQMPAQPQGGQAQNFGAQQSPQYPQPQTQPQAPQPQPAQYQVPQPQPQPAPYQAPQDPASINSHISRSSLMATHSLQGRCRELTT